MRIARRIGLLVPFALALSASADIVEIGPFAGQRSENLENITSSQIIDDHVDVFGGDATFESLVDDTTIHLWRGSSLNGDHAIPRSGVYLIGATTAQAIVFHTPFVRFGSYFTNTSQADDATALFFDANGVLVGSDVIEVPGAGENWHWNGWESDVPIGRIEIRSNGLLEGFIWLDDLELTQVPEPASVMLFATFGLIALRPKRARHGPA
jgi:hypothetical protein